MDYYFSQNAEFSPDLLSFDQQLSALSPDEQKKAILAIECKERIRACLSDKAPFSLVQKFAMRAVEVKTEFSDFEKARIAHVKGNKDEAKKLYRKAAENDEGGAYNNLGLIAEDEGKFKQAIRYYRKAASMGNIGAYNNFTRLTLSENELRQAKELCKKCAESGEISAPAFLFGCIAD